MHSTFQPIILPQWFAQRVMRDMRLTSRLQTVARCLKMLKYHFCSNIYNMAATCRVEILRTFDWALKQACWSIHIHINKNVFLALITTHSNVLEYQKRSCNFFYICKLWANFSYRNRRCKAFWTFFLFTVDFSLLSFSEKWYLLNFKRYLWMMRCVIE